MSTTRSLGTQDAAEALVELRRSGERRDFEPDALADTVAGAYAVAGQSVALSGRQVVAWKLGGVTAGMRLAFAAHDVVFGPICAGEMFFAGDDAAWVPPILQAEAEIALRLGRAIASADDLTPIEGLFDAWAHALEAPYSVVANLPAAGLTSLLSDRCATGALYLTQPKPMTPGPSETESLRIEQNGAVLTEGTISNDLLMAPRAGALRFLELALDADLRCRKGQWISTGGVTTCVPLQRDAEVILRHGDQVVLTVTPTEGRVILR